MVTEKFLTHIWKLLKNNDTPRVVWKIDFIVKYTSTLVQAAIANFSILEARFSLKIDTNNVDRLGSSGFYNNRYLLSKIANNIWFKKNKYPGLKSFVCSIKA